MAKPRQEFRERDLVRCPVCEATTHPFYDDMDDRWHFNAHGSGQGNKLEDGNLCPGTYWIVELEDVVKVRPDDKGKKKVAA